MVTLGSEPRLAGGSGRSEAPMRARPAARAAGPAMRRASHSIPVPTASTATLPISDGGMARLFVRTGSRLWRTAGRFTVNWWPQARQKLSWLSRVTPQRAQVSFSTLRIIAASGRCKTAERRRLWLDGRRVELLARLDVTKDIAAMDDAEQFFAFDQRHLVDVAGGELREHLR